MSGVVYTARDASHRRLLADAAAGILPVDLTGQVLYYAGPSPAAPGRVVGSIGPTTSARMDAHTPAMLELGVKGFIGKGRRSEEVRQALMDYKAVYFLATAGVGALLSRFVVEAETVAYPDLGPEAVLRLVLNVFPAVVADDIYGGDLFEKEWARWKT